MDLGGGPITLLRQMPQVFSIPELVLENLPRSTERGTQLVLHQAPSPGPGLTRHRLITEGTTEREPTPLPILTFDL